MQFERGINQLNKFGVAGKSIIEIRIPHWWLALKGPRLAKRLVRETLPRDSGIGMDSENPATAVNAAANATNTNTNTIPPTQTLRSSQESCQNVWRWLIGCCIGSFSHCIGNFCG